MHEFSNRNGWFLRLNLLQWYIIRIFVDLDSSKASENVLKFSNFNKLSKHQQSLRHHIERWSSGPKQQKCGKYNTVLIINYINYEKFCCKLGTQPLEMSEEKKALSILSQRMSSYWHRHNQWGQGAHMISTGIWWSICQKSSETVWVSLLLSDETTRC